MKERPILFSSEMVRAILDGRKTQTRRTIKPQPNSGPNGEMVYLGDGSWGLRDGDLFGMWNCPYGGPGDRLYVKEAWQTGEKLGGMNATEIAASAQYEGYKEGPYGPLWYPADGSYRRWGDCDLLDFGHPGRKRSSRFMPKWASRITLEITEVRAERLQDIDEIDAQSEGVFVDALMDLKQIMYPHVVYFKGLWDDINGKFYPWDSNPFVWAISFKMIKP